MSKLAISLFKNKARMNLKLIITYAFLFLMVLSILPVFSVIEKNIIEKDSRKYGRQHAIIFNLSDAEIQNILKHPMVKEQGLLVNLGEYSINNKKVSIGYFDEKGLELGMLSLSSGTFPRNSEEIAIENNLLYFLPDGVGVGSFLELEKEGELRKFKITGIINDFRGYWDTQLNVAIIPGNNDLPNIIIGGVTDDEKRLKTKASMLLFKTNNIEEDASIYLDELILALDNYDFSYNYKLYGQTVNKIEQFEIFKNVFSICTILCIGYISFNALHAYNFNFVGLYNTLFLLGTSVKSTILFYMVHNFVLIFIGVVIGFCLSFPFDFYVLSLKENVVIAKDIISTNNILFFTINLAVIVCSLILVFFVCFRFKDKKLKRRKVEKIFKVSLSALLCRWFGDSQKRSMRVFIIMVLMLSTLFCFLGISLDNITLDENEHYPDFYISAHVNQAYYEYGIFSFYSENRQCIALEDALRLSQMPGVKAFNKEFNVQNATMIIPNIKSRYWQGKGVMQNKSNSSNITLNIPQGDMLGVQDYDYRVFIIDESTKEYFYSKYSQFSVLNENEVIVFAPPYPTGTTNDTLKAGDKLVFGYLHSDVDFDSALEDSGSINFSQVDFIIKNIVDEEFILDINGEKIRCYEKPVIVMTEGTAKRLVIGVDNLYLYLDPDITEEQYNDVEKLVKDLGSAYPNMLIESLRDRIEQDKIFADAIHKCAYFITSITGIYILSSIYDVLLLSFYKRKKSLLILKSLGLSDFQLFSSIFLELLYYLVTIFAISFFFNIPLQYILNSCIWSVDFTLRHIRIISIFHLILLSILFWCFLIMAIILTRSVSAISRERKD